MSASPAILDSTNAYHSNQTRSRRRPFSQRRIEANRRNALHASGPRTPEGKARVASNAIKHGFFAGTAQWTLGQHRDFRELHEQLRGELKPLGRLEEYLIAEMALASVKTAMMLRYEGLAAIKFHRQREDELNAQIAAADPAERTRLERQREHLKCAGLWGPTIPGERDARAITRYGGSLDRGFHRALADFEALRDGRERSAAISKSQKQTHSRDGCGIPTPSGEAALRPSPGPARFSRNPGARSAPDRPLPRRERGQRENAKTNQLAGEAESCPEALRRTSNGTNSIAENAKTNPLSAAFASNRHERRRAEALDRKRRSSHRTGLDE